MPKILQNILIATGKGIIIVFIIFVAVIIIHSDSKETIKRINTNILYARMRNQISYTVNNILHFFFQHDEFPSLLEYNLQCKLPVGKDFNQGYVLDLQYSYDSTNKRVTIRPIQNRISLPYLEITNNDFEIIIEDKGNLTSIDIAQYPSPTNTFDPYELGANLASAVISKMGASGKSELSSNFEIRIYGKRFKDSDPEGHSVMSYLIEETNGNWVCPFPGLK